MGQFGVVHVIGVTGDFSLAVFSLFTRVVAHLLSMSHLSTADRRSPARTYCALKSVPKLVDTSLAPAMNKPSVHINAHVSVWACLQFSWVRIYL